MVVEIPDDLLINQITNTKSFSKTDGISDNTVMFSVNSNGTMVIKNAFRQNSSGQIEYTLNDFSIYVANLTSPRSTRPTSSFKIYIYDVSGYSQYKKEAEIYGTVTSASTFKSYSMQRTNLVNGANGTYTFTLQLSQDCYKGEYIKVVPPDNITIAFAPE